MSDNSATIKSESEPSTRSGEDSLRLLGILFFVIAGMSTLSLVTMFVGHATATTMLRDVIKNAAEQGGSTSPAVLEEDIDYILTIVSYFLFFFGIMSLLKIILQVATGWSLIKQKRRVFCMVGAILTAIEMPLGTILGIYTMVVLLRPHIKELFAEKSGKLQALKEPPARGDSE